MKKLYAIFSFLFVGSVMVSCKDSAKEETSSENQPKKQTERKESASESESTQGEPKSIYELLGESGVQSDPKPKGGKTIVVGRDGLYEKKEPQKENQSTDKE